MSCKHPLSVKAVEHGVLVHCCSTSRRVLESLPDAMIAVVVVVVVGYSATRITPLSDAPADRSGRMVWLG